LENLSDSAQKGSGSEPHSGHYQKTNG
jgi:hypothetical protein